MMNARIFSIAGLAAVLAMGAGVAQANPFEGDQAIAPRAAATSSLSRAQVQTQLEQVVSQVAADRPLKLVQ